MPLLLLHSNNPANPQALDLSNYLNVQRGEGMDPYNPSFTNKVFSRSLLKVGGTLALEQLQLKELLFPLLLNSVSTTSLNQLVMQINQVLQTPGATVCWKDDGAVQPTWFDLSTGQFDIQYDFRETGAYWLKGNLRLFAQPLGRTAGPRPYAVASGVGPVLMISPYASNGANILGPSGAGFGGVQQPSGGILYAGNPSLAGDAAAQLQISYLGPSTSQGVPYTAVALLPDQNYQPLVTVDRFLAGVGSWHSQYDQTAVGSTYWTTAASSNQIGFYPVPGNTSAPAGWAGNHRLFAIARASINPVLLSTVSVFTVQTPVTASVMPGDWGLYDLGTIGIRASETAWVALINAPITAGALDLTAFVMLPDQAWFVSPRQLAAAAVPPVYPALSLDGVLDDQFYGVYASAMPPALQSKYGVRITQLTRGRAPTPEPLNGLPIIAILGVPGASPNPQNQQAIAQISIQERTRYAFG